MPFNNFSIGRDLTLQVVTPTGPLQINKITGFMASQDQIDEKIKGLDGVTQHVIFPDGWKGEFEVERQDGQVDAYFAQLEAAYYAGSNLQAGTITETILESDNSVSVFQFQQVLLKLLDAGKWEGAKTVKMKIGFVSSQRVQLA